MRPRLHRMRQLLRPDAGPQAEGMGQPKYQNDGDPRTSGPGFAVTTHPDALSIPRDWREPRLGFVGSMSGLFPARVPRGVVRGVFDVMGRTPRHTHPILTQRVRAP